MHFNAAKERARILQEFREREGRDMFEGESKRFCVWVNLCLHPYTWEQTYACLRVPGRVRYRAWENLGGAIMALFININRFTPFTAQMVGECQPDFVEYIRSDKIGDPWKFLLSMRRYMPRYIAIKSLSKAGIHWQDLAVECMGAKHKSQPTTYHSLFTNKYVRSTIKALVVFRQYRSIGDEDYSLGTNDLPALVRRESASPKCVGEPELTAVVERLQESLPSWSVSARSRACFFTSYLMPLHYLTEKQMLPSLERKVLGTNTKD